MQERILCLNSNPTSHGRKFLALSLCTLILSQMKMTHFIFGRMLKIKSVIYNRELPKTTFWFENFWFFYFLKYFIEKYYVNLKSVSRWWLKLKAGHTIFQLLRIFHLLIKGAELVVDYKSETGTSITSVLCFYLKPLLCTFERGNIHTFNCMTYLIIIFILLN